IDVVRLGPDDDVVGTGDVVSLGYAGDLPDMQSDVGGLTNLCLDEDISLNHAVLPGAKWGGHATVGTRCRPEDLRPCRSVAPAGLGWRVPPAPGQGGRCARPSAALVRDG